MQWDKSVKDRPSDRNALNQAMEPRVDEKLVGSGEWPDQPKDVWLLYIHTYDQGSSFMYRIYQVAQCLLIWRRVASEDRPVSPADQRGKHS